MRPAMQLGSILAAVFLVTGCTQSVRYDSTLVTPSDRIGVWTTWSKPLVDSGGVGGTSRLTNTLMDTAMGTTAAIYKELYMIRTHDIVEAKFIRHAATAFPSPLVPIKSSEIVLAPDGKTPDLIATAKKRELTAYIHLGTSMRVVKQTMGYSESWIPMLRVRGEMVRVSDGKVLWRTATETGAGKGAGFKELYEDCATNAVRWLIQDLERRN